MRRLAVTSMFRAYRPTLPLPFITATLAFDDDDECRTFLTDTMAAVMQGPQHVDCKASLAAYLQKQQQK